ncbi:hypothetical protein ACLBXM_18810 [Xanthobacteraceae bacterium A53D]
MMVRPGRGQTRQTAAKPPVYQSFSFPAPTEGWVSNVNLATGALGAAHLLDNFFPTATGALLRRGCVRHATLPGPVRSLFTYVSGAAIRLFGVVDTGIWDVSTSTPAAAYTLTSGRLSCATYTSSDGTVYVRGVNGVDAPWLYDGASFATTPALTFPVGDGTTPADLAFTWVFKDRFWFIRAGSLDAYYLPIGTLAGALTKFPLGGLFRLGGSLVFGASWSQETGGGLSSMCAFATDQGEVAVFAGSDPGSASDWRWVGTYTIGKPLGPNAVIHRGGDLAICTDVGLVSLSQALLRDTEAVAPTAMSRPIETDWAQYAAERSARTWAASVWTEGQMLVVAPPTVSGATPVWLVANATTGKWARFTGWDASCLAVHAGGLFFGSPSGKVFRANVSGADDGAPYVGAYAPLFSQMGGAGGKTVHMLRAVTRARVQPRPRLSVHADFEVVLPAAPDAIAEPNADVWGTAKWGTAKWGDAWGSKVVGSKWKNAFGEGEAISIGHQITSASIAPLDAEIIRTDVLFTVGEIQS